MLYIEAALFIWEHLQVDKNRIKSKDYLINLVESVPCAPHIPDPVKTAVLMQLETAYSELATILLPGRHKSEMKNWTDTVMNHKQSS